MNPKNRERALSQGSLDAYLEEKKRKRQGETSGGESAEEVGKETKISRTSATKGEEMEKVIKMLEEIKADVKTIKKENHELKKEMEQLREDFKRKEKKWQEEKIEIEERMGKMERKVEQEERRRRRNNIIIKGWKTEGSNDEERKREVEKFLKEQVAEVKTVRAYNVGKDQVLVEMDDMNEKRKIMCGKNKLKGKKMTERIYIEDDLTHREREIQRKIVRMAKEKKGEGNQVKIGYKKIIINGEKWEWDEKEDKLKVF